MARSVLKIKHKPLVMIIEGCDLSGKSTLVHELGKEYPGIVIKVTKRPLNKKKEEIIEFTKYMNSILGFINHNRQTKMIILDRFFPSELVYSLVKRGYEAFGDGHYREMEKVIRAMDHLYIYCNPGYDTLVQRLKDRGDDHIIEEDIRELSNRYEKFFRETKMNKVKLDTSKPVEGLVEIIKKITL